MKTIHAIAAAAAAFAATFAASPPAVAQPVSQLVVSYADLDLSTRDGVRQLDRRLRTAVQIACGPTSDADLAGKNEARECRAETLAHARAQREVAIAGYRQSGGTQIASGQQ